MSELISTIHVYYSSPVNIGSCEDAEKTHVIYDRSALDPGRRQEECGWQPAKGRLQILFDLQADCRVEYAEIQLPQYNTAEWEQAQITVMARAEQEDAFEIVDKVFADALSEGKRVAVKMPEKPIRFIRYEIKRGQWRCSPLPYLWVYGTKSGAKDAGWLTDEQVQNECNGEPRYIDKYGQVTFLNWKGKVLSDDMLKAQRQEESLQLADVHPDIERYDQFGGWKSLPRRESTGFFRLEKIDGRWWFITPDGYPFIMKGVDLVTVNEKSYFTPLYQYGTQTVRTAFAELPDREQWPEAYTAADGAAVVNYLCANLMRKYGRDYEDAWADVVRRRLIDWSFNTAAKWDKHPKIVMPYVYSLREGRGHVKIRWAIDPFDPKFEQTLCETLGEQLSTHKDDPYLVGYHFTNEAGWDRNIVEDVLKADGSLPAKGAFVVFVRSRYQDDLDDVNRYFQTEFDSFDAMLSKPMGIGNVPDQDIAEFIRLASQKYFEDVNRVIKRYDPNHLFMGSALTPGWHSSPEWETGGAQFMDAISFDTYNGFKGKWLEPYLYLDKPILNLEFSFTASDRGHDPLFPFISCGSQAERGKQYRDYVRGMFRYPQFVGIGFFILYDQPPCGRNEAGKCGECHNFGLVDLQDQPFEEFVSYVKETNATLEEVHADK